MIDCLGKFFATVVLFVGNLAILAFACVLIYAGVASQYTFDDFKSLDNMNSLQTPQNATIAIIVLGAIIGLVAFMGCCGALKQSPCLLYTYGTIIFLFLVAEIAAVAVVFYFKGDIETEFKNELQEGFNKGLATWTDGNHDENNAWMKSWNKIQNDFECCGFQGPEQYNGTLPTSCCDGDKQCNKVASSRDKDCYNAIKDQIIHHLGLALAIGIALALIQLLIITFACCLAGNRRKNPNYY